MGVTSRCIIENEQEGKCIFTNKTTARLVIFAKAY